MNMTRFAVSYIRYNLCLTENKYTQKRFSYIYIFCVAGKLFAKNYTGHFIENKVTQKFKCNNRLTKLKKVRYMFRME